MKTKRAQIRSKQALPVLRPAQPILDQRGKVIQPPGELLFYPLSLAAPVRRSSVAGLNQVLADTLYLRDMFKKHPWQASGATFHRGSSPSTSSTRRSSALADAPDGPRAA